jgi:adenylate kinase family enzyme
VRRVSVVGNSGSGKTTLAAALGRAIGAPHLELDAIFHQPNWEPLERAAFRSRVAEFVAADAWVVDGNYSAVRDLVWARADTVVWLDLPRHRIMRQLIVRTLRRMLTRAELWNGNTEQLRNLFRLDPNESILRWAWTQHGTYVERYGAAARDPEFQHLRFIRVSSPAAAAGLVAGAAGHDSGAEAAGGVAGV